MKAQIIKIGNSRGIRIPKSILDQSGLGNEVDIQVRKGELIISRANKPRENWVKAFRLMSEQKDDIIPDFSNSFVQNQWDESEWEW